MKNVEIKVEKNLLHIEIDLTKECGRSVSGKSIIIATTEGNQPVAQGIMIGLNVYKKI